MNIFCIYNDPIESAIHLVDKHVSKMVLESAQMLANCFTKEQLAASNCPRTKNGTVRKHSYFNHPCSIWTRSSRDNMRWLIAHAKAMDKERMARSILKGDPVAIPHYCIDFINWVEENLGSSIVAEGGLTKFAQAMPDEFKCEDSVSAYRHLYKVGKAHLHTWTKNKPDWI